MKPHRIVEIVLCLFVCSRVLAQDMDTELSNLADKLASQIKEQGKKKVAVIDFSGLDGNASELGRYVSEQLTVDLVMDRKDFSVLDRANLKKILDEHKLSSSGLVDPDNAKKLGQFAGVDALILGTITPKNQSVSVTAKVITTDTAEIVGAGKATFKTDSNVELLLTNSNAQISAQEENITSHSYMGISYKAKGDLRGVTIVAVTPDSPADRAGLSVGDVIMSLDDTLIPDGNRLYEAILKYQPRSNAKVKFLRNGSTNTVVVTMGAQPNKIQVSAKDLSEDKPQVTKALGSLVVQLMSLRIVNGDRYVLTMNLTNRSKSGSVWVALSNRQSVIDPGGNQFSASALSGVSYGGTHVQYSYGGAITTVFEPTTQIQAGDSTTATITFASNSGSTAPGVCNVQLEFMFGTGQFEGQAKLSGTPNLIAKMEAK